MTFTPSLRTSLAFLPALAAGAVVVGGAALAPPTPLVPADSKAFEAEVRPRMDRFCAPCHTGKKAAAGVDVTAFASVDAIQKDPATWRRVMIQIRDRAMPPHGSPQPTNDERELLTRWIAETVAKTDEATMPQNPGRVLAHRLSRAEYNNTVRDLLGITTRPADKFPADGSGGGGFDNNADTLFLPPVLFERYLEAASEIVTTAPPTRVFLVRPSSTLPVREAARQTLQKQAFRAWRRPVDASETAGLVALYDGATKRGETWENAVRYALKAVLVSPNFLYRTEGAMPGTTSAAPVSDFALASRLSYFLWASTPDDELLRLATENKLHEPGILQAQTRRMLQSPKARALSDNFAGQWLRVRELYTTAQPDPGQFPQWTPTLRDAMYNETILFVDSVLRENKSVLTLLDADYTFVNSDLAKHYGLPDPGGNAMRRVPLPDNKRGGLLTQASVLTVTSYPRRTSPVLRGKWVLDEILGTPPPPPPPVVATLSQDDHTNKEGLTFRQRLEKHREKPECAGCHSRMDPLGFGLENYDVVGRWRDKIGDSPVDATGTLATGEKFSGPAPLKKLLLARRDDFVRNVTERLLSYALGRGLEPYDAPTVRRIVKAVEADGCRTETLIMQIVQSYPFRFRTGDASTPAKTAASKTNKDKNNG